MSATVLQGDALALPVADKSVDLVVTSPPYFGLRSYKDAGQHYAGQIGAEATPAEFTDALVAATAEMVRVLKPTGSIFVNLGDKYVNKTLTGLPWRYALRCIDDLDLILRAEIVWSKPNGLPESVTDRVRRSHETWFHLTKSPRYYANLDEAREPSNGTGKPPNSLGKLPSSVWSVPTQPLRLPSALGVKHFAAFPMEWPRRFIKGWCPPGICVACGEGRRTARDGEWHYQSPNNEHATRALSRAFDVGLTAADVANDYGVKSGGANNWSNGLENVSINTLRLAEVLGGRLYAYQLQSLVKRALGGQQCGCPKATAPTTPAVVLDPFGGTGTTATVAHALGRHGITVDLSHDYCRVARWRTTDPGQLAKAAQTPKPRPVVVTTGEGDVEVPADEPSLLDLLEAS